MSRVDRRHWSEDDGARLMEGIANGQSIDASGRRLGLTRGAAIGRFNRLRRKMGCQAQ